MIMNMESPQTSDTWSLSLKAYKPMSKVCTVVYIRRSMVPVTMYRKNSEKENEQQDVLTI